MIRFIAGRHSKKVSGLWQVDAFGADFLPTGVNMCAMRSVSMMSDPIKRAKTPLLVKYYVINFSLKRLFYRANVAISTKVDLAFIDEIMRALPDEIAGVAISYRKAVGKFGCLGVLLLRRPRHCVTP
jgi:hypothetical protein